MKKFLTILLTCVLLFLLVSCSSKTPYIGENGNWWIGDEDLGVAAQGPQGEMGISPKIEISEDGYWVINGEKTDVKANGENRKDAVEENSQGLDFYLKDDGTYTVAIGHAKYLSSIIIPATYQGKMVTEIASVGFSGAATEEEFPLKEIVISKNIKMIGMGAFFQCTNLKKITFEEGSQLENVAEKAFYACSSLENISLPSSIRFIGDSAFDKCDSLKYTEYGNAYYLGSLENPYMLLVKAQNTEINTCEINKNTLTINKKAFYECANLKNIFIPKSVLLIGVAAFGRSGLENIEFDADTTIQYIGNHAFEYTKINQLIIPKTIQSFTWGIFSDCSPMLNVVIPTTVNHIENYISSFGANNDGDPVGFIFFEGNQEQWVQIKIDITFGDSFMPNETDIYFYSESKPESSGNYWRYVAGVPTIWE